MDFQIIAGEARSGKTAKLQQEIIDTTQKEPDRRIIYIVPEQATLMAQRELLEKHPRHGILQVEILSFNRLAYRVLQETGADRYQTLDDMGKSMLLYKTALDHREELLYYRQSIHKPGFIGQLKIMMTEMYQYQIDEVMLTQIAERLSPVSTLRRKLHDIGLLYTAFREKTAGQTIPTEQLLDLLAEHLPQSELLEQADIYMDDFFGFTPQQYSVLERLWAKARRVRITLPLSRDALEDWKQGHGSQAGSMYYQSVKILNRIREMGIHGKIHFVQADTRREELQYLTNELFRMNTPKQAPLRAENIRLYKAERPEEEMEWVLYQIEKDIHERGLTYADVAILAGSEQEYLPLLERYGERYQVPVYIDKRVQLKDHPVVRMLLDALQMVLYRFSFEAAFSWIKSGFLPYSQESMDKLENQALKEGWRGPKKYEEGLLLQCVDQVETTEMTKELFKVLVELGAPERTSTEYTDLLRKLLSVMRVEEQLRERAERFSEQGQALFSSIYEQAFSAVLQVLTQLENVIGEETLSLRSYYEILQIGFGQSKLGLIPPTPDRLQVADLTRSRLSSLRELYIVGFQDEYFPQAAEDPGLLTDAERREISRYTDAAADRTVRMGEQEFYLYNALGKASERIVFTYSASDSAGKGRRPSQYVKRLETLFTIDSLTENEPVEAMHPNWLIDRLAKKKYEGAEKNAVRRWLMDHDRQHLLDLLAKADDETLPDETLEPGLLWDLMGLSERAISVTQLEQYAQCPLSYYFRYGLSLKERDVLSIRPLDDGNVLHALLENVGPRLSEMHDLSAEEIELRMQKILDEGMDDYGRYEASSRYLFYWQKLKKTATRAVLILQEQLRRGEFQPEAFEWTFGGPKGKAEALSIELSDGRTLSLMGKIDRVDLLDYEKDSYVRILDYKTGRTDWSLWDVYEGVKLQLPVYLDAYQKQTGARPAGIFYFHVTPELREGDASMDEQKRRSEIMKSARLDGLVLDEDSIASKMDVDMQGYSEVIPARRLSGGQLQKTSSLISEERFHELTRFAKEKAAEIAEQIADGHMNPAPTFYPSRGTLHCSHCEYRSVCRLDPDRDRDAFRTIEPRKEDDFWKEIETE